ncbi:MAG: DUF393 domain-containing protein [Chitinophagaceae bacterium]|nr:DUF393 domain-containing protein [Chitinophagaceae bacterium]
MKSLDHKLIVYDSNCKVCSSWRDFVLRFTSIPGSKITAYKELPSHWMDNVDDNKFKNGMALIDTNGERTIYGAEGVAYIFASQYPVINFLLKFPPLSRLFDFFYKVQAYNRYIIATPKSKFKCDCLPDRVVKYRVSYIVLAILIAATLTGLFGTSLRNFFMDVSSSHAAVQMLLIAGTGWVVQITLAFAFLKDKALDYIGHLGSIMLAGLLILVPWMLFYAITGVLNYYIPVLSVIASSSYMLYLHVHRARYLEMSQAWTLTWFLLLQVSAAFWIYFFYLK